MGKLNGRMVTVKKYQRTIPDCEISQLFDDEYETVRSVESFSLKQIMLILSLEAWDRQRYNDCNVSFRTLRRGIVDYNEGQGVSYLIYTCVHVSLINHLRYTESRSNIYFDPTFALRMLFYASNLLGRKWLQRLPPESHGIIKKYWMVI